MLCCCRCRSQIGTKIVARSFVSRGNVEIDVSVPSACRTKNPILNVGMSDAAEAQHLFCELSRIDIIIDYSLLLIFE